MVLMALIMHSGSVATAINIGRSMESVCILYQPNSSSSHYKRRSGGCDYLHGGTVGTESTTFSHNKSTGMALFNGRRTGLLSVTAAPYGQAYQVITSDSAGGAIIAWQDMRNLLTVYSADIYAQRINIHGTLATGVLNNTLLPETTVLRQNYPNPFNPTTNISFTLASRSKVSLKIFDILGREVATIVSEELAAGIILNNGTHQICRVEFTFIACRQVHTLRQKS